MRATGTAIRAAAQEVAHLYPLMNFEASGSRSL